jgi:hypothetical protein
MRIEIRGLGFQDFNIENFKLLRVRFLMFSSRDFNILRFQLLGLWFGAWFMTWNLPLDNKITVTNSPLFIYVKT